MKSGWRALLMIALVQALGVTCNAAPRPNIVVLLCDDLGYGDLSCFAHPTIRTPHLDQLAADGVGLSIPFFNLQVGGGSQVEVVDEGQRPLQRQRLHQNAHGSKRSLERELAAVKLALSDLMEDSGMPISAGSPAAAGAAANRQTPQSPRPDATLEKPATVVPAKK